MFKLSILIKAPHKKVPGLIWHTQMKSRIKHFSLWTRPTWFKTRLVQFRSIPLWLCSWIMKWNNDHFWDGWFLHFDPTQSECVSPLPFCSTKITAEKSHMAGDELWQLRLSTFQKKKKNLIQIAYISYMGPGKRFCWGTSHMVDNAFVH